MRANALAVMAKAPLPGETKTRLMPALSAAEAAEVARALLLDQFARLSAISDADMFLVYTPASARPLFEQVAPPRFHLLAQQGEDLGARMLYVFETLYAEGYGKMVLIGGDLPPVPLNTFTAAFSLLDSPLRRVVLGPSRDGGYYLVGCNQPMPEIFTGMSWSHGEVLAQTISRLTGSAVETRILAPWFDIDTMEDLHSLQTQLDPELANAAKNLLGVIRRLEGDGRIISPNPRRP